MISKYVFKKLETGPQRERRRWVLVYLAGLLLVLAGSLFGSDGQNVYGLGVFMLGVLLFTHSSFQLTRRHQLAEIANLPIANLDERQQQVRLQASELAYTLVSLLMSLLFIVLFVASHLPWQPNFTSADWVFIAFVLLLFFTSFRLVLIAWLEPDPLSDETDLEKSFQVTG